MCIQVTSSASVAQPHSAITCAAQRLDPEQRQELALQALLHTQSITQLAHEHDVSRKFVYQQANTASQALHQAFALPDPPDDRILFTVPVTKRWLRRFILALLLIGHCSYRGVVELLRDIFDYALSVERVHAIAHEAMQCQLSFLLEPFLSLRPAT